MAKQDPSVFEYSLADYAFVAIASGGQRFDFSNRVSSPSDNPNASSSVGKGSSQNPVYHTTPVFEPTFALSLPADERTRFRKWVRQYCAADKGVCNVEKRRAKPRVKPVIDLIIGWLPLDGEEAPAEGEGVMVEVSGNYLEKKEDTTKALAL